MNERNPASRLLQSLSGNFIKAFILYLLILQLASAQELSSNELTGKKLFLQRCSVCHMPAPSQLHMTELLTYGPILEAYIKDAETESRSRQVILEGTPRMPGFRYGLSDTDIDRLVNYLKIFKLSDFIHPGQDVGGGPDKIIPVKSSDNTDTAVDMSD